MAIHKTRAVVLRRQEYRNTSLIVTLSTERFGKLQGIAKGIRAARPRFASQMDVCGLNEIVFYEARASSLHLVTQAALLDDLVGHPPRLPRNGGPGGQANLATWPVASYFAELVDAVTVAQEPNPAVFELLLAGLREIAEAPRPEDVARVFEVKMLAASGFMPRLRDCLTCNALIQSTARLSVRLGGLLCPRCTAEDRASLAIAPGTVATIAHLERSAWAEALRLRLTDHARLELRHILTDFLEFHLDRRFPSLAMLRGLLQDAKRRRPALLTKSAINRSHVSAVGTFSDTETVAHVKRAGQAAGVA